MSKGKRTPRPDIEQAREEIIKRASLRPGIYSAADVAKLTGHWKNSQTRFSPGAIASKTNTTKAFWTALEELLNEGAIAIKTTPSGGEQLCPPDYEPIKRSGSGSEPPITVSYLPKEQRLPNSKSRAIAPNKKVWGMYS